MFWTHSSTKGEDLQPKMKDRFLVIMGEGETLTPAPFAGQIMFTAKSVDKPSISIETKDFKLMNHKFKYPGQVTWEPIKITLVDMAGQPPFGPRGTDAGQELPPMGDDITGDNFFGRNYMDSEMRWDDEFRDKFKKIGGINFQNSSAAMAYLLYGSGYDTPGFTAASGKSNNTGLSKAHLNTMLQNLTIQQLAFTPDATINIGGVTSGGKISAIEQWTLKNPIIKSISWGSLAYGEDGLIEYTIDIDYDYAEVSYNKTTVGFRITE